MDHKDTMYLDTIITTCINKEIEHERFVELYKAGLVRYQKEFPDNCQWRAYVDVMHWIKELHNMKTGDKYKNNRW